MRKQTNRLFSVLLTLAMLLSLLPAPAQAADTVTIAVNVDETKGTGGGTYAVGDTVTLMTTEDSPPLELRITSALNIIMQLYQVPEQTRKTKIDRVLTMDYHRIGRRVFKEFAGFVEPSSEQAIEELLSLCK